MLQKTAPEIDAISLNSKSDSGASFQCQCMTSNIIDCLWVPNVVNYVRSCASARETGDGIWRQIYGSGFWRVCQGPKITLHKQVYVRKQITLSCK